VGREWHNQRQLAIAVSRVSAAAVLDAGIRGIFKQKYSPDGAAGLVARVVLK
jgi:hypothetical protein